MAKKSNRPTEARALERVCNAFKCQDGDRLFVLPAPRQFDDGLATVAILDKRGRAFYFAGDTLVHTARGVSPLHI